MVSSPVDDGPSDTSTDPPATDGSAAALSEEELYAIVRVAAEDAVLGALGTLMLVGIGIVLIATGASTLLADVTPVSLLVSVVFIGFGVYLTASSLGVIPPAREWV
ncbi:hypothetical protein [Haloarcula japonica]|uniref:Uncharacterized protein n=1 Tax=Haloarcula japonica (strain ATCC 49778 / DSM 6131 / JCM 7785 / NBRC 101032 / NCIMB 13157 / TR-1) TaxID=1227453 RepID=M0LKK1_HALJT|nr:hypothetical protein [Haloarcula japonica]EMA33593.1 hypothetical protein C444_04132 [Haloarcula japonica DSM 6131]